MLREFIENHKPFLSCKETDEYLEIVSKPFCGKGEVHHILPESIYPELVDVSWNLVNLSYQDHYRVHELLPYMLVGQGKYKMLCAWNQMCGRTRGEFVDKERYAFLKEEFSKNNPSKRDDVKQLKKQKITKNWSDPDYRKAHSGENHPMYGKKMSEEHKEKLSKSRTGVPSPLKGKVRPNLKGKMAGNKNPLAKSVVVGDLTFGTQKEAADHFGVTVQAVSYWVKTGKAKLSSEASSRDWSDGRQRKVIIDGCEYQTMKEASKNFGVSYTTLRNWMKVGRCAIIKDKIGYVRNLKV